MILAAGLGTRLRPLTLSVPKALVPVMGRPMLDWAMAHLSRDGIRRVIINLHHLPDPIVMHVAHAQHYGVHVTFSPEPELLGTGGGVKKASWFLDEGPFVLRNVDVLAGFSTAPMVEKLVREEALAVRAVQRRETSRALLWTSDGRLCGRLSREGKRVVGKVAGPVHALGFAGIHAVSSAVFPMMPEDQPFCIIELYLKLAAQGHAVMCHNVDGSYWRDLGTPAAIQEAERELETADPALWEALGMRWGAT
jgi:NDP-sugar pyrophosphorylase family protein